MPNDMTGQFTSEGEPAVARPDLPGWMRQDKEGNFYWMRREGFRGDTPETRLDQMSDSHLRNAYFWMMRSFSISNDRVEAALGVLSDEAMRRGFNTMRPTEDNRPYYAREEECWCHPNRRALVGARVDFGVMPLRERSPFGF